MPKLRVGIPRHVEYQPLAWGFLKGHHGDLFTASQHAVPVLINLLEGERLDVALLPSTAVLRMKGVDLLPDLCLSARGQAGLAALAHRCPLERIDEVLAAPESEAAYDLLALLMAGHQLPLPRRRRHRSETGKRLEDGDAALLTGPAALESEGEDAGLQVMDLVETWESMTRTPWVEALWAVRRPVSFPDLNFYFKSSLRFGLAALDTLVREAAAGLGLSPQRLLDRFRDNFTYVLREPEHRSLEELRSRAERSGLIPEAALPPFRS